MVHYLKQAEPQSRQSNRELVARVRAMLDEIEQYRDDAVKRYAAQLDRWTKPTFRVSDEEIGAVRRTMSPVFKEDFAFCKKQVTDFAKRQRECLHEFEESFGAGITLGQKIIPVETVGCYIPGGKYPLISAAIMSVATAKVAGVPHVIGAAPPRDGEAMYAPTLYALSESGADEIYTVGGVQAFASMAYGCVGMKAVDMITGPGNAYVAEAKRQLFGLVGIDLPAGPTEILILADESADPPLVATDLLGQAEHGPTSPAVLVTHAPELADAVLRKVELLLRDWPTRDVAGEAWRRHGEIVVTGDRSESIEVANRYAHEHVEVHAHDDELDAYLAGLRDYGSLFLGSEATVVYGDKAVGTNHVLPTARAARYTGGLWVGKFLRTATYQRLAPEGTRRVAPAAAAISDAEGFAGHALTARKRLGAAGA